MSPDHPLSSHQGVERVGEDGREWDVPSGLTPMRAHQGYQYDPESLYLELSEYRISLPTDMQYFQTSRYLAGYGRYSHFR